MQRVCHIPPRVASRIHPLRQQPMVVAYLPVADAVTVNLVRHFFRVKPRSPLQNKPITSSKLILPKNMGSVPKELNQGIAPKLPRYFASSADAVAAPTAANTPIINFKSIVPKIVGAVPKDLSHGNPEITQVPIIA